MGHGLGIVSDSTHGGSGEELKPIIEVVLVYSASYISMKPPFLGTHGSLTRNRKRSSGKKKAGTVCDPSQSWMGKA